MRTAVVATAHGTGSSNNMRALCGSPQRVNKRVRQRLLSQQHRRTLAPARASVSESVSSHTPQLAVCTAPLAAVARDVVAKRLFALLDVLRGPEDLKPRAINPRERGHSEAARYRSGTSNIVFVGWKKNGENVTFVASASPCRNRDPNSSRMYHICSKQSLNTSPHCAEHHSDAVAPHRCGVDGSLREETVGMQ
jgi:hypothetical protein